MARARRASRGRSGGGAGQAVTVIVIVALLGGLAWFGWTRIQAANKPPEVPSGPRVTILALQSVYRLKGNIPDPLSPNWRLSFQVGPFVRRTGESTINPRAWIELQMENGEITGMTLAVRREAKLTAPFELLCDDAFAGGDEGRQLREFINQLANKPEKSWIEGTTANFKLFAWKHSKHKGRRRSVVCAVRSGAPEAERMFSKAKSDWKLGLATGRAEPKGPRTTLDVVLVSFDKKNRDKVLAVVCELSGLTPDAGGTLIDNAPRAVKVEATREEAEAWRKKLEAAGAKVEVK
jgi:ribosomal protein L7/L12